VGTVVAERYQIEAWLGGGACGDVYRALDREHDHPVALKLLRPRRMNDVRQVHRFRREFRAVARIDHPGCLRVFAEGQDGGQRFIAMEYVAGGNLGRLIGAPSEVLLVVCARLSAALDCVHARRIVHRDLKPANVLLTPEWPPQPKLADFGIVKLPEDGARLTDTGALLGTIDYMAPEAVDQRGELDPRADLYSLGCLLFELWAGKPPFGGPVVERLRARLDGPAPRLGEALRDLPEGLDALVARLLERAPEDRPQRAADVARELVAIHQRAYGGEAAPEAWAPDRSGGFLYRPPLVGRGSAHDGLVAAVEAARVAPRGRVILVTGAAGVGKSALLAAAARTLGAAGYHTSTIRERDPNAPFAPLSHALAAVEEALGTARADVSAPSMEHSAGATRPMQPVAGLPVAGLPDDGAAARRKLARALADGLRELHRRAPFALLLEDLHEAGPGALDLLVELAAEIGRGEGERPVIVATLRPAGRAAVDRAARRDVDVVELTLEPLDATGVAQIAAAMLATPEAALPKGLVDHLDEACEGNPLACQSAVRAAVDRGHLRLSPEGWVIVDDLPGAMSAWVGEVLEARLGALSPSTRALLGLASLCDGAFDVGLLCAAAGAGEDTVLDALDEALRASVIRPATVTSGRDGYRFEHGRLLEVLRDELDVAARADAHDAIGAALLARGGAHAGTLALHFGSGTEPALGFRYLFEAGRAAFQVGDHRSAADHLGRALELAASFEGATDQGERLACLEMRADALVLSSRVDEGTALLDELASTVAPRAVRARWLRKLGMARLRSADLASGLETLQRGLSLLRDRLPRGRFALRARVVRDKLLELARRALRLRSRPSAELEERAIIHRELALMHRWIDVERSFAHMIAFSRLAHRLGLVTYLTDAYAGASVIQAMLGWPRSAARSHERARALAVESGDLYALSRLETTRGGIEALLTPHGDAALLHLDLGVELAERSGDRFLESFARSLRGAGAAVLGQWHRASDDYRHAEALAVDLGVSWLAIDAACGRAALQLLGGELDEAEATARRVLGTEERLLLPAFELLATQILAVHALCTGRYADAVRNFDHAGELAARHRLDGAWTLMSVLGHGDALLCLADEMGERAVPDLLPRLRHNALRIERRLGWTPLRRRLKALMTGVYLARSGQHDEARRMFSKVRTVRLQTSRNPVDLWMRARLALESARLDGEPAAERAELDELVALYRELRLDGFGQALAKMRSVYGV
jgi:tetratricopeptide (TPR) repeat protein